VLLLPQPSLWLDCQNLTNIRSKNSPQNSTFFLAWYKSFLWCWLHQGAKLLFSRPVLDWEFSKNSDTLFRHVFHLFLSRNSTRFTHSSINQKFGDAWHNWLIYEFTFVNNQKLAKLSQNLIYNKAVCSCYYCNRFWEQQLFATIWFRNPLQILV
jgi:hypothetical protein